MGAKGTFEECIKISTRHSLVGMIMPGLLVIFTPIFIGIFFGPNAVAGYLVGVIISGIRMATSSANSGGAWDNCKKAISNYGIKETLEERLNRELRGIKKAFEICKNHTNENRENLEKFEELIKQKDAEIERLDHNEELKYKIMIVTKKEQTEEEKNEREIELRENIRDVGKCIEDAEIEFYEGCKEAAVIGDTVGDPLKDTSGPSINILIKLSSIISVIFADFFLKTNFFGRK